MMRMMVVMMLAVHIVARLVAMTAHLVLEDEAHLAATIVMMMGHNGMKHDNRTC